VSCLATFIMRWLIPRLYTFGSAHPGIEVRLFASHAPVRFADEGIDVAIRIGKPPWPRRISAHRMFPGEIGPVLAPALKARHRLARPSNLRRLALLRTDTRPQAWSEWLRLTGRRDIAAADGPRYEHTYFLLEAAASGPRRGNRVVPAGQGGSCQWPARGTLRLLSRVPGRTTCCTRRVRRTPQGSRPLRPGPWLKLTARSISPRMSEATSRSGRLHPILGRQT
jgi:DNA-binding transcriptional LysR family regulator